MLLKCCIPHVSKFGKLRGGHRTGKGQFLFQSQRRASLVAQMVNGSPTVQETQVPSLGGEDPLEKEMATHSSILAWRIPWTEEPRPGGRKQLDMTERLTLSLSKKGNGKNAQTTHICTHFTCSPFPLAQQLVNKSHGSSHEKGRTTNIGPTQKHTLHT